MESITNSPTLFFTENNASIPITAFEKEVFLTTIIGKPIHYTIRAYPNQRIEVQLNHPPLHGEVEFKSDRTFSYQPRGSFKGIDTFSCHLQNGLGRITVVPFTVIISSTDSNKKDREIKKIEASPLTSFIPTSQFSTPFGKKLMKDIPVYEESEEPYTVSLRKSSTHGRVKVFPDGTFEYTPSTGFQGRDSFQVSQHFAEDTKNITVEVLVLKPAMKKPNQVKSRNKRSMKQSKKK